MQESKKTGAMSRVLTVVGIALCVLFGLLLICNLTVIIKGSVNPDRPPSVLGVTPMVVVSGSMSGDAEDHIEVGDLILTRTTDPAKLQVGDVIAFQEKDSVTVVTHRILQIDTDENGAPLFTTKGDANNTKDDEPVTADRVVGIYWFRLAGLGNFALFLQTPLGMLLFIGVPLLAFIIYDILRRQHYANREKQEVQALEEELERLRALTKEEP